ncbi:hypothetical protein AX15_004151 [Amanita polypyramis BW_CC]|nr:hypothetical protein AX15_004151 [Amanita polypyramis BW_CC]
MQARRPQGVTPITLALPPQSLQSCRSSLLSAASSPRTPCGSPQWSPIYFSSAGNRNSTDSWNSSNGPDELEWEWKQEQVLLLTRTLDALPAHLVTPFIGPVPPSNLLDKIARGVAHAKGPADWPHSIRATRVKLLELAKIRAKEEAAQNRATNLGASERENKFETQAENARGGQDKRQNIRRPLYRQNSMDFMNVAEPHLNEDNITRLSNRLQRTDKTVPTSLYHSYTRKSRLQPSTGLHSSSSPTALTNPSTSSSSTLTSLASWTSSTSGRSHDLRRSASSVSTTSSMSTTSGSSAPLSDPRLQRVKSTETDVPPAPPPKDAKLVRLGAKRAPSYGTLIQGNKHEKETVGLLCHERRDSTASCPSSDEEEKARAERVKKPRTKLHTASLPVSSSNGKLPSPLSSPVKLVPSTPVLRASSAQNVGTIIPRRSYACTSPNARLLMAERSEVSQKIESSAAQKKLPMNLQRNPSILGDELPQLSALKAPKQMTETSATRPATPITPTSADADYPMSKMLSHPIRQSPSSSEARRKMLRRVRRIGLGRRISFGGLLPITDNDSVCDGGIDADVEGDKKISLGSAFQMH